MAEIKKVFKENIPNMRFIGKKYSEFGHWDEFWANDWFGLLEKAMGGTDAILNIWENGGGQSSCKDGRIPVQHGSRRDLGAHKARKQIHR